MENTKQHFTESVYEGFYRDDGFAVQLGKWDFQDISEWREGFQDSVNLLAEGDYLQYSCEVWDPDGDLIENVLDDKVTIR